MVTSNSSDQKTGQALSDSSAALGWDTELDSFVVRLEKAYGQASATSQVDIADYCPPTTHPRYDKIVRELIRVDMELAATKGVVPSIEYYRQRFSSLIDQESICMELEFEQNRLKQQADDSRVSTTNHTASFPEVGQTLCGFELRSELGRGSFGRVYIATETGLSNRRVVLKVSSQFPGEADLLAKLQHKNIVPIYSLHRHNPWHVVCMPLLGTATLGGLLQSIKQAGQVPASGVALIDTIRNCSSGTWPVTPKSSEGLEENSAEKSAVSSSEPASIDSQAINRLREKFTSYSYAHGIVWMISQLADGLSHAHERNILHRDIKPANILLSDDGLPMLLDFNLAVESIGGQQPFGVFGGTPRYMAPEQLSEVITSRVQCDQRSDLYALGIIMFELLAMRSPFPDRSGVDRDVLQRMSSDRQVAPLLLQEQSRGITSGIQAIVGKCLEYLPENRYSSAQHLLEDLSCELNHQPLKHATGESLADRVRKWNRRHPRLSATTLVASAASVLLGLVLTGFVIQYQRATYLRAVQWISDAKASRTIASGLIATSELPAPQVQSMISACNESLTYTEMIDKSTLNEAERREADHVAAQLWLLQARGEATLATQEVDSQKTELLLRSAIASAARAAELNSDQSRLATVLKIALERSLSSSDSGRSIERELRRQLQIESNQVQGAIESMKASLSTDAGNPWYWTNLAQLQLEINDLRAARTSLEVAVGLKSDLPWPSLMLGTMELDHNRFSEAKKLFDETLRLDSSSVAAYLNRAIASIGLGDFKSALEDLNKIEKHSEENTRILFVRELVHRRLGHKAKAEQDLASGLAMQPRDARSWNSRGEAKLRAQPMDAEGALEDFRQASLSSPHLRNSYENMATVLSEYLKRPEEAIQALDQAIECDPQYALAWSGRSVLHARVGHVENAIADARRALELERTPIVCYQAASAFALVRRDSSDETQALALLKETARQNPALAEMMEKDADLVKIEDRQSLQQIIAAARQLK